MLKFAPQPSEVQEGVAFFGRTGQAILKSLQRLHVDPLAVYGTNCLKFADGSDEEGAPWLLRELNIVQPKLVVVMGERALAFLNALEFPLVGARAGSARRAAALHADGPGARDPGHRRLARRSAREDTLLERVQGARPLVGGATALLDRRHAGFAALAARACGVLRVERVALGGLDVVGRRVARAGRDPGRLRRRLVPAAVHAGAGALARARRGSPSRSSRCCCISATWKRWRTSRSS